MSAYDSRTKLEALRDHFETFSKGANYLLIGHGAGLVGCLSVVKDHPEQLPSQLQGIGQLSRDARSPQSSLLLLLRGLPRTEISSAAGARL
jgi:hypothetical protein